MEAKMVVKVADSILSPLGLGSTENYNAVKSGRSALKRYEGKWGFAEPFVASCFDEDVLADIFDRSGLGEDYTRFEKMAIVATAHALGQKAIDVSGCDTKFVIASTKGNVHLLADTQKKHTDDDRLSLLTAARKIAKWFGNSTTPLVISNACVSGLYAQVEAMRILQAGRAETVVVIAADMLSPFIVSGFQAFKSVSDECCRPFDCERLGLNLGEAAACMVFQNKSKSEVGESDWVAVSSAVFNDAYHISHPSKSAEGSYRALAKVMEGIDPELISMVNLHGTATMFNDEMEAVALERAGLSNIPVNSLKGYLGHTLGAAGLLETLVTMSALEDGIVLGTRGFSELGVSRKINISAENRKAVGKRFIKLISGFGGCNAAMMYEMIG